MTPQRHELLDFSRDFFRRTARPVADELDCTEDYPDAEQLLGTMVLGESDTITLALDLEQFLIKQEAKGLDSQGTGVVDVHLKEMISKLGQMDPHHASQLVRIFNLLVTVSLERPSNVPF